MSVWEQRQYDTPLAGKPSVAAHSTWEALYKPRKFLKSLFKFGGLSYIWVDMVVSYNAYTNDEKLINRYLED